MQSQKFKKNGRKNICISSSVTSSQSALQVYASQVFLDSLILFDLKPSLSLLAAKMHFFSFLVSFFANNNDNNFFKRTGTL